MGGVKLIERAKKAGLSLSVSPDGKLVVTGPRKSEAVAREVIARKAEVLAVLAPEPAPADGAWERLAAMRWGPAVGVGDPGIIIEEDWRWEVANLPHEAWATWRAIATQLLGDGQHSPEEIHEADRVAAEKVGIATG